LEAAPRGRGAVLVALVLVWLARGVSPLSPTMWAWGPNLGRFLPPWAGLALVMLSLLPVVPALGSSLEGALSACGTALERPRGRLAFALLAGIVVLALPDRTWFTGDFLLRQGTSETGGLAANFAHAMPLEVLIDRWLPMLATPGAGADPNAFTRVFECLLSAALAACAVSLADEWGLRGGARAVAVAVAVFGGHLTAFTGLGRPAALGCLLTATTLLGSLRLLRADRGGALLGVSLGLALLAHRGALMLLPLWAFVVVRSVPRWRAGQVSSRRLAPAVLLPALCAAAIAPRMARVIVEFDLPRHVTLASGAPRATPVVGHLGFGLLELLNLLWVLVPALPLALLARGPGLRSERRDGTTAMWVLSLSSIAVLLLIHPVQGVFRDLEVFAPAGLALSLHAGRGLGSWIGEARGRTWLAAAIVAATVVPSLQWLVHFHDPSRGMARARAFAVEAPRRSADETAQVWDFLAYRAFRASDWPVALETARASAAGAPNERALVMWAMARTYNHDAAGAESIYASLASRYPGDPVVWLGLGGAAIAAGDTAGAARANARLNSFAPGSRERRIVQRTAHDFPEMWPPLARAMGVDTTR